MQDHWRLTCRDRPLRARISQRWSLLIEPDDWASQASENGSKTAKPHAQLTCADVTTLTWGSGKLTILRKTWGNRVDDWMSGNLKKYLKSYTYLVQNVSHRARIALVLTVRQKWTVIIVSQDQVRTITDCHGVPIQYRLPLEIFNLKTAHVVASCALHTTANSTSHGQSRWRENLRTLHRTYAVQNQTTYAYFHITNLPINQGVGTHIHVPHETWKIKKTEHAQKIWFA
jgi:hypothetical protein